MKITNKAAIEIKRLQNLEPEARPLRISIVGGGCSGMSYKLNFEQFTTIDDKTIIKDGLTVIIDKNSSLYLEQTTLDFSDGLNGTGFTFRNDKAKRTCGCGSSFEV